MAYNDVFPKKTLRPEDEVNAGAQPVARPAQPAAGTKIGHLTLLPGSGADQAAKAVGGFFADTRAKHTAHMDALKQAHPNLAQTGTPAPTLPAAAPVRAPAPTAAPTVNLISPTRPDFGSVRPPTRAMAPATTSNAPKVAPPAQGPAATAAGGGGSAPTGRVLGTFTGKNGTRTITEADAATLAGRLPTASGPVVMGPNGSYATSSGGAPAGAGAAPALPTLPRPTYASGGGQGAVIGMPGSGPEGERAKMLSALNDQIRGIGTANTRGKRDLLANLLRQQSELTSQSGELANRRDIAQLQADTSLTTTRMGQEGEDYRAVLGETGDTERALLSQAGENYRLLNRPEYTAGADGNYTLVQGGVARPVTGADGQPFKAAGKDNGGLTAANVIDAYDKARQAIVDTTPMGQAPDFSALDATPTGQAYTALFAGNSAGGRAASGQRPTQQEFMAKARAANPGVSDAQLQDYYQRTYGQ